MRFWISTVLFALLILAVMVTQHGCCYKCIILPKEKKDTSPDCPRRNGLDCELMQPAAADA